MQRWTYHVGAGVSLSPHGGAIKKRKEKKKENKASNQIW
jgi:hypothetical protein